MLMFASDRFLSFHLSLCDFFSCLEYRWDPVHKLILPIKNKSILAKVFISKLLHFAYLSFQLGSILGGGYTTAKKIEAFLFFTTYAEHFLMRIGCVGVTPAQMLNSLSLLETKLNKNPGNLVRWRHDNSQETWQFLAKFLPETKLSTTKTDRFLILLQPVDILANFLFPTAVALLLLLRPCQPPFLASIFLPSCTPSEFGFLSHLPLLATEATLFFHFASPGSFIIVFALTGGLCSISKYTTSLRPHSSTAFRAYRTLQVAEGLVNDCLKHTYFPALLLGPPVIQMFAIFACIKLHTEIEMPLFALFPLMVILCGVLTMMPLLAAGKTYKASKELIKVFASRRGTGDRKQRREWARTVRSIKPLRIQFGGNFVDACTPLVVEDFCMRTTASLLLYANLNAT